MGISLIPNFFLVFLTLQCQLLGRGKMQRMLLQALHRWRQLKTWQLFQHAKRGVMSHSKTLSFSRLLHKKVNLSKKGTSSKEAGGIVSQVSLEIWVPSLALEERHRSSYGWMPSISLNNIVLVLMRRSCNKKSDLLSSFPISNTRLASQKLLQHVELRLF